MREILILGVASLGIGVLTWGFTDYRLPLPTGGSGEHWLEIIVPEYFYEYNPRYYFRVNELKIDGEKVDPKRIEQTEGQWEIEGNELFARVPGKLRYVYEGDQATSIEMLVTYSYSSYLIGIDGRFRQYASYKENDLDQSLVQVQIPPLTMSNRLLVVGSSVYFVIGVSIAVFVLLSVLLSFKKKSVLADTSPTSGETLPSWQERDLLILLLGIGLALAIRFTFFPFLTHDTIGFIGPWYTILKYRGFSAMGDSFYNYTPLYPYLLYLSTILTKLFEDVVTIADVTAVKTWGVIFDFICATYVYKIVRLKYENGIIPILSFVAILFAPTVVLNASFWGQADIFYTTALVASVYYLLVERERAAFVAYGIALAFKLQAFFLFPLLLALTVRRLVNWKSYFYVPLVYLVSIVPAWIAGRPLWDLLMIYAQQGSTYHVLSSWAPNLYTWFSNKYYDKLLLPGFILAGVMIFVMVVLVYKSPGALTKPIIIQLACFSALITPYFLPKMHDRYFFPADVLSIVFACYYPRYWWASLAILLTSFFSYFNFLFNTSVYPIEYLAIGLLVVIVLLARHLIINLFQIRRI